MSHPHKIKTQPLIVYKGGKTCVFWDVSDYPIPNGLDPVSFCRDIKDPLVKEGFTGEVSIQAYVDDRDTFSDELQSRYSDAEIGVTIFPEGGKFARISFMLVYIMLWAMSNPVASNLIALSKKVGGDGGDVVSCFEGLYVRHCGVLLSKTEPGWRLPSDSSVSFLTSLFDPSGSSQLLDNKKRKRADTLADPED